MNLQRFQYAKVKEVKQLLVVLVFWVPEKSFTTNNMSTTCSDSLLHYWTKFSEEETYLMRNFNIIISVTTLCYLN